MFALRIAVRHLGGQRWSGASDQMVGGRIYPECSMAQLKKKPVVMFVGYFDESGITDDSEVSAIAGFMGGPPAMNNLAKKWDKVLAHYDVRVPFHSVQFYAPPDEIKASTTNPFRG